MTKPYEGSQIVPIRIRAELLARIDADVERSIQHDSEPRSTRTAWILHALREVFRHRTRAKKARWNRRSRRLLKASAEALAAAQAGAQPETISRDVLEEMDLEMRAQRGLGRVDGHTEASDPAQLGGI